MLFSKKWVVPLKIRVNSKTVNFPHLKEVTMYSFHGADGKMLN